VKIALTAERLRELLEYDPETGIFRWLVVQNNRMKIGQVGGTITDKGYRQIRVDGVKYRAHRLAWLYMTGEWPEHELDHINGIKDGNWWNNLRPSNRVLNLQNQRKARSCNKSGLLGVTTLKNGKFQARITVYGKLIYLGLYTKAILAHNAYISAKRELHEACTI
jgi:hypothetical protein